MAFHSAVCLGQCSRNPSIRGPGSTLDLPDCSPLLGPEQAKWFSSCVQGCLVPYPEYCRHKNQLHEPITRMDRGEFPGSVVRPRLDWQTVLKMPEKACSSRVASSGGGRESLAIRSALGLRASRQGFSESASLTREESVCYINCER